MKPRYRSPSGRGEHPLADGDGDRQAGDSGHGSGTVPAFHSAEHARPRHGEHEHPARPGLPETSRDDGLAERAGQDEFFQSLAAGEPHRA